MAGAKRDGAGGDVAVATGAGKAVNYCPNCLCMDCAQERYRRSQGKRKMAETLIDRARTAVNSAISYRLGHGGLHPADDLPSRDGMCDCSGFIAWLVKRDRRPQPDFKWWLSTDSIYDDATGAQILFQRIPAPVAGCIAVYPDHDGHQGHVALIVDPATWTIIDCSSSQNGIREHVGKYWATAPRVAFCLPKVKA